MPTLQYGICGNVPSPGLTTRANFVAPLQGLQGGRKGCGAMIVGVMVERCMDGVEWLLCGWFNFGTCVFVFAF